MKQKRGRIIRRLAACLLAAALAGMAGTQNPAAGEKAEPAVPVLELPEAEQGRVEEIPVEQDSLQNSLPPLESCYLYGGEDENPTGYADPSITVNLGTGTIYGTKYLYARIKIASASQLRTLLASPVGKQGTSPGHNLAKRVQAVIAINGDFCGGDGVTQGALMRQGEMLRQRCDGRFDLLAVDRAGDVHILRNAKDEDVQALGDQAVNIFTFGPALVVDGEPIYGGNRINLGRNKQAQRMAICQTGPLEYLLITSEGPENPTGNDRTQGLTLDQFVDLVSSMPDVKMAYNLDGGSSATMVFRSGEKNWTKINALSSGKIRPLKDIIYFATAFNPEKNDFTVKDGAEEP